MKGFIKGILLTVVLALPIHGCAGEMLSISELVSQAEENVLLEWNQTYEAHERIPFQTLFSGSHADGPGACPSEPGERLAREHFFKVSKTTSFLSRGKRKSPTVLEL